MKIDTLKEFYHAVKSLNLTWKVDPVGYIRCTNSMNGFACPRIAVGETYNLTRHFVINFCPKIYAAADNTPKHDSKIRKALLEACGLNNG